MKELMIKVFFTGIWLMIHLVSLAQNYELVWSDEFNYSGPPDPDIWTFETGPSEINDELQYYTDRLENAEVRDSILVITARKESYGGRDYTSARINTYNNNLYWQYGKFEARIKLPYGQGIWPAFFMFGKNIYSTGWPKCGEIDILEMIGGDERENIVYGGVMWYQDGYRAHYRNSIILPSGTFADDFHIFSIEWNAERILWKMDGTQFYDFDITGDELSEFHNEFFINLCLAVGGFLPGSPDSTTIFPQELQVDYVRVYSVPPGESENSEYERQLQLFPNPLYNEIMIDAEEKFKSYCVINFTGTGDTTVVDSVWVKNLKQNTSITLMGNDILQLNIITDVNTIDYPASDFKSLQVYPDPIAKQTTILKSAASTIEMPYNEGDRLLFIGMSGNYTTIVTDVPTGNKTITFDFINCMDADSSYYPVVIIGTQTWMAENLKTTKYNDNTAIPLATDNTTWANSTTPAYCWYNNDEATYKDLYGALYNWHTVNTEDICPVGWHVPGNDEWKTLEMYLGMSQSDADAAGSRGTNEGDKLKESGTEHWVSPNTGATNESGFSALPGGYRNFNLGSYNDLRIFTGFWSSTEYSSNSAWYRTLHFYHSDIERYYGSKEYGASVRCVRD